MTKLVTEAGYYNGKFLKAGMTMPEIPDHAADDAVVNLASLNKDDLVAEAKKRTIEVDPSKTKAEIIAAIEAGSN
ncbi:MULTISPECIES: hypothetical protein [unclassified Rhizobium]|uniref:hypothetical protein n=1 Tax=unclassified Rhizobium TaxID=2613769 RepID=UPI001ADC7444|nr:MULTISPECIES: hypothetical protein [unclassified Rhizobium]MBO9125464.1 hypothetical protein [Rhizobium sp. 16-488-2b]MBO9176049.1 hypothetical protein [Rhizobium sp. 16-488-2a]